MLPRPVRQLALASALVGLVFGQESDIIPQELQTGFADSGIELQVSYTGDAVNGFLDGTIFRQDEVARLPEFALGDSSGISSQRRLTILLVDTTCDNAKRLHYARTNFRYNFEFVKIESDTPPVLAYLAPGAFDETGDERKYSWLMYSQPRNSEMSTLEVPAEGDVFDVEKFQQDNGFKSPAGGVGMVVQLGGETSCDGNPPERVERPSSSSVALPTLSSTTPESSSVPAPSTSPPPRPTNTPESPTSSNAERPSSTAEDEAPSSTTVSELAPQSTSDLSVVTRTSTVAVAPSSTFITSAQPDETSSQTSTGAPAEQTTSNSSTISVGTAGCVVVAAMFLFAGLLV